MTSRQLAVACAQGSDDKKAEDITILDVRKLTFICDFFVIATTQSERQSKAISEGLQSDFKKEGIRLLSADGLRSGKWALLDFGVVVMHFFQGKMREFYDLVSLWAEAPRIKWKPRARPRRRKAK